MDRDQARTIVASAVVGFERYADRTKSRLTVVKPGSEASADEAIAGSNALLSAFIGGLMTTAADQLGGWAAMAGSQKGAVVMHIAADYTLLRPAIEALTEIIWILDGDTSEERIKRSVDVARIELFHGESLANKLRKAGTPDETLEMGMSVLRHEIERTLGAIGLDEDEIATRLAKRPIDPTKMTLSIGRVFPRPTFALTRYWGITSAHAHGQLITILSRSVVKPGGSEELGYSHGPDEVLLAEVLQLVQDLIGVANKILKKRGYAQRGLVEEPGAPVSDGAS